MNYPVVMSTPEIEQLFPNVYALPTSFFIDREGRIAQKHVGMLNAVADRDRDAVAGGPDGPMPASSWSTTKTRCASRTPRKRTRFPASISRRFRRTRKRTALQQLNSEQCTCGCGLTVAQCRLDDPTCNVSLPTAQAIVKKITGN